MHNLVASQAYRLKLSQIWCKYAMRSKWDVALELYRMYESAYVYICDYSCLIMSIYKSKNGSHCFCNGMYLSASIIYTVVLAAKVS